jgi:PAS domain S-box-containing protein
MQNGRPNAQIAELQQRIFQLENELDENLRRYRAMIEMSSDGALIIGKDEKIRFVNSAAARLVDAAAMDLTGKRLADAVEPEIAGYYQAQVRKVFSTGKPVRGGAPFLFGKQTWVDNFLIPMMAPDGSVDAVFCIMRDITEQKLMENALKQSEERFRQIIEQMPYPVVVCSPDGTMILVNAAFLDLFKIPSDETVLGRMNVFTEPVAAEMDVLGKVKKAFDGETVFIPELFIPMVRHSPVYRNGNFGDLIVEATLFPVYLQPGDVFQVVIICKNITEQKQSEQALKTSDDNARTQYRSFPIPTYTCQKTGDDLIIIDYNDAAMEFTKGGVARAKGRKLSDMFADQPVIAEDALRCLKTRTVIKKEMPTLFPFSKEEKLLNITYVYVEPDLVMVHTEDNTAKRKMEEEIRKSEHLESLGILAGGIAHDFNNFLAGVFGYIGLTREYGKHDPNIREYMDRAMVVFGQAKALTQQLLTFSKGGSPVRTLASISELTRDLVSFVFAGTTVKPEVSFTEDLWACEVDTGQLSEVINNILINAQQAMPEGGIVRVNAENCVLSAGHALPLKNGNYVKIIITDAGVGIPKQYLARVFDPFFTTKQKGSGLGLAVSYSIIKKHEGHIEISSEVGAGTSVSIYLPASAGSIPGPDAASSGIVPGHGKILLMDDESFILDAISRVMGSLGYTVVPVKDGGEAVGEYTHANEKGEPFDAVILDLTIPGGRGGKQTLLELSAINPDVKAIATSGYSDDPVMANPRRFGFIGALRKPYTVGELSGVLQLAFAGKKADQEG